VGPRAGLDAVSKRKIPGLRRDSNPDQPIVQLVASRSHYFTELETILCCLPIQRLLNGAVCNYISSSSSLFFKVYAIHGLFQFRILTSEPMNLLGYFGRTPCTGDQPDARPLPTQDNTT
jgi:hypothetical protein